jgi:hypothetical protein
VSEVDIIAIALPPVALVLPGESAAAVAIGEHAEQQHQRAWEED